MAAVFEAISVWINGSQHRLLEVLQWLFPIVGALIGYLSTLAIESTRDGKPPNEGSDVQR
jgi:hypothetical protein